MPFPHRPAALALLSVSVVGCAAKPVEDNSPLVRTAIIKSEVSNSGIKGRFGYEGTYTSSTASDIRRRDDAFKFSGSILSRIGGSQDRSNIVRLDKGVEWALDNKAEQYSECPLGGCRSDFEGFLSGEYAQEQREDDLDEDFDQDAGEDFGEDSSCRLSAVEHTFEVEKSGQSRDINGFDADEYTIDWRMSASDNAGNTLENIVAMNVWTTQETPVIAEALRMHDAFDARYAAARGETYPENVQKALPPEVVDLFTRFLLSSLSEEDVNALKRKMANAADIEGFPVSRKVKWDSRNETCTATPEPETEEEKGRLNTSSLGGLFRSVGKQIVNQEIDKKVEEKQREIAMAPIMLFVEDVQSIEVGDIRESRLSVPAKYKLVNRR